MNKICTSLEQSKKLIKLGIDISTADMDYIPFANEPKLYDCVINTYNNEHEDDWIPAWSLSALLGLIPTNDKEDEYYVDTESHSDYHTVSYINCWDGCVHLEHSEESLLDAAFEMVVWLKKNKKLCGNIK